MTTKSLMRLCAAFESTVGAFVIAWPDFVIRDVFGGVSSRDVAVARGVGFILLFLGLACWPFEDDINPQTIWAQLIYNLLTALYLGYLRITGEFASNLLWPICVLHTVIAVLLVGIAYEKLSATKSGRANQH
jgi:hypothetical protein